MKKLFAGIAAVAVMASVCSSVSAVDWSKTTYADNNPDTCVIENIDENGVTWSQAVSGDLSKIRFTWADVLENPDDLSKVYSGTWNITYKGLSKFSGTDCGWLGGGTYVSTGNSAGYGLAPDDWAEDGTAVWNDEQTVEDSFKWLLGPADDITNEIVVMDWSGQDMSGVTFTISNFKIFDKEGNEIAQKAFSGDAAAPAAEEEAVVEEAPAAAEEAVVEEAPAAVEEAPAPAEETTSTATGNAPVAAAAAVMGVAAAMAFVSRKKK